MRRREMMQRAAAALCAAGIPFGPLLESAFAAPAGLRRLGKPEPFDYAKLKGQARQLGAAAYKPRPDALPPAIAALNWDKWQSIRFRNDQSLWADDHLLLGASFFHAGFTIKKPVRMFIIENNAGAGAGLRPQHVRLQQQRSEARPGPRDTGLRRLPAQFPHRLDPRRGGVPGRVVLPCGGWRHAVRHVPTRPGREHRHAVSGGVAGVHRLLSGAAGEGFEPADRLWPARLPERRRRLQLRHRSGRHAGDGRGCGAVPAQAGRAHWHRAEDQHVPLWR